MAIEIIPKKAERIPSWQNILLYISIIVFVFAVAVFFILNYYVKKGESALSEAEDKLIKAKGPQVELEKEILNFQKKINDFGTLVSQHKRSSNFFEFLETLCHPDVFFHSIDLIVRTNKVSLLGKTKNFETLEQQILIFKNEVKIKNVELMSLGRGEEGGIEFKLEASLDPLIFTRVGEDSQ